MNITIWIVIALVCFVLPAAPLTNGGRRAPGRRALERHARTIGLPLPAEVAGPVITRIRRRERGMLTGGIIAIILGGAAAILLDGAETWGALLIALAGTGTAFGGALAMAAHRPPPTTDQPVVARLRSAQLSDYLTSGERFGLLAGPAALVIGVAPGVLLLSRLPGWARGTSVTVGLIGTGLALLAWALSYLVLKRVLSAPARSGSDLELAWDDAERALGLRQLANLAVAVTCVALGLWLVLMAQCLTSNGFYRQPETTSLTWNLTLVSLLVFGALIVTVAAGPVLAWITGERKGYEQRRLWPNSVTS
ncbi:hypothetical protein [Acidipropionibacterium virtanenii]|uniref:Uncharacterized protein n=1 Tax=Acidipropionibacterium virtanenii TaxID=2057246 RepID=A0A344UUA6_9ACTN|nr:hypothetical protein [Acidipropionibacterium virtanenii]AXE38854.1 hypothetical protein JS278_01691 [Acidipropionibacterium virtanenii]